MAPLMSREATVERAGELHKAGYNCAQAVACATAEALGLEDVSPEQLFAATEGLGLGMGGMLGTCGAISGACIVAGLVGSTRNLEGPNSKQGTYQVSRELMQRYQDAVGSVTCGTIKGQTGGPVLMGCHQCVLTGAGIAYDVLVNQD